MHVAVCEGGSTKQQEGTPPVQRDVPLILVRLAAEAAAAEEAENYQHQDDDHDDQQNGERWPPSGDGLLDVQSNASLDRRLPCAGAECLDGAAVAAVLRRTAVFLAVIVALAGVIPLRCVVLLRVLPATLLRLMLRHASPLVGANSG